VYTFASKNLLSTPPSGKIPESLGNCVELKELVLYANKLEGKV
jgi:hypothetical protein